MKPILFNTEMVRAIIAGRKTQTRRIVPEKLVDEYYEFDEYVNAVAPIDVPMQRDYERGYFQKRSRFNKGDILYVRETFSLLHGNYIYLADGLGEYEDCGVKWRPSIHMPAEAARLFLRITDVRVERLNEISEEDAIAEGVGAGFQMNAGWPDYTRIVNGVCELTQDTAALSFQTLWDSVYGNWDSNPWVWVYTFERIEKPTA